MPPSPILPDLDRPFPFYRVVIAGVFLLVLLIVATIGSMAPAGETPDHGRLAGVLDPDLRGKLERYAESMSAPRPVLEVETADGRYKTDSCAGFVAFSSRDGRGRALMEHPLASAYEDCTVMRILHNARQPEEHVAPLGSLGHAVFSRLDPATLQEMGPAWAGKAARLAGIAADRTEVDGRRIELVRGKSAWAMEIVASVDIAGPPVEDLVVRISRDGKTAGFMVLMTRNDGSLTALPLDVFVVGGGLAMAQAVP
ncbi:hypothetical protein [Skermanella pratensis]|uniref:hypothetical protein n=1 Tax=Skermanella pratensis TaxID=2233999 RepID=UPI00130112C4|nr:hypothetical protein [Skermanella pratensis]